MNSATTLTPHPATPGVGLDPFARRLEYALGYARVVRAMLHDSVIGHLPPLKRTGVNHVIRRLDRGEVISEATLSDVEMLIGLLDHEAEAGTHHGWQADEHHIRGGWPTLQREPAAATLAWGALELRRFHGALAAALDAAAAERHALNLLRDS